MKRQRMEYIDRIGQTTGKKNSDTSKGSKKVENERNAKREVGLKIKAKNERGEKSKSKRGEKNEGYVGVTE